MEQNNGITPCFPPLPMQRCWHERCMTMQPIEDDDVFFPIAMDKASNFMEEFTAMGSVSVSYDGSEIANLALAGAAEAVDSMMDCQAAMAKSNKIRETAEDPFAPKPDAI